MKKIIFFSFLLGCSKLKKPVSELQIYKIVVDTTKNSYEKNIKMVFVVNINNRNDIKINYDEDSLYLNIYCGKKIMKLKTVESEINYHRYEIKGNNCNKIFVSRDSFIDITKIDSVILNDKLNKQNLIAKKNVLAKVKEFKKINYGFFSNFYDKMCICKYFKMNTSYLKAKNGSL